MSIAHDKPIDRAPAERNVSILFLNLLMEDICFWHYC